MANRIFTVEVHGPTGAGKTILLASLYKHLMDPKGSQRELLNVTDGIVDQLTLLESGKWTLRTTAGPHKKEVISYKQFIDGQGWVEIRCTAHRGEDLGRAGTTGSSFEQSAEQPVNEDAGPEVGNLLFKDFAAQFSKPDTLLVAVANPFLWEVDLGYRAVLGMAAMLQKPAAPGDPPQVPLTEALHTALKLVLGIDAVEITKAGGANYPTGIMSNLERALADLGDRVLLVYDHDAADASNRFIIKNLAEEKSTKTFTAAIKDLTQRESNRAEQKHAVLTSSLSTLPDAVLALTHVDLDSMIRSVDARDYRDVFNAAFHNNSDRKAKQDHLSRSIRINTRFEPTEVLTDSADELCNYIRDIAARKKHSRNWFESIWLRIRAMFS